MTNTNEALSAYISSNLKSRGIQRPSSPVIMFALRNGELCASWTTKSPWATVHASLGSLDSDWRAMAATCLDAIQAFTKCKGDDIQFLFERGLTVEIQQGLAKEVVSRRTPLTVEQLDECRAQVEASLKP